MKKLMATLILAGLATSVSAAGIHIEDGWARATVEGMKMGGAFMKIQNDEAKQDFLVGGSSPVAERVEVHTHINDNGVMRMREVKGGVPLAAKGVTELKPGSYHVMFMGLKKPLKEGEKSTCNPEIQKREISNCRAGSENCTTIRHGSRSRPWSRWRASALIA